MPKRSRSLLIDLSALYPEAVLSYGESFSLQKAPRHPHTHTGIRFLSRSILLRCWYGNSQHVISANSGRNSPLISADFVTLDMWNMWICGDTAPKFFMNLYYKDSFSQADINRDGVLDRDELMAHEEEISAE